MEVSFFAQIVHQSFFTKTRLYVTKTRLNAATITCIPTFFELSISKLTKFTCSYKFSRGGNIPAFSPWPKILAPVIIA